RHDALARAGEDVELAEGRNVVDAGVGAGIGEHDESVADQDATAIRHDVRRAPAKRPYIPIPVANPQCASSILGLLRRLLDADLDRKRLADAAVTRPAQGRRAEVIEPDGDPHMGVGCAKSVGRIESNPAELGHEGFRPGVAGLLLAHAIVAAEIAADIARGNTEAARGSDEDVGEVPTRAALERESLGGRGGGANG